MSRYFVIPTPIDLFAQLRGVESACNCGERVTLDISHRPLFPPSLSQPLR